MRTAARRSALACPCAGQLPACDSFPGRRPLPSILMRLPSYRRRSVRTVSLSCHGGIAPFNCCESHFGSSPCGRAWHESLSLARANDGAYSRPGHLNNYGRRFGGYRLDCPAQTGHAHRGCHTQPGAAPAGSRELLMHRHLESLIPRTTPEPWQLRLFRPGAACCL